MFGTDRRGIKFRKVSTGREKVQRPNFKLKIAVKICLARRIFGKPGSLRNNMRNRLKPLRFGLERSGPIRFPCSPDSSSIIKDHVGQ